MSTKGHPSDKKNIVAFAQPRLEGSASNSISYAVWHSRDARDREQGRMAPRAMFRRASLTNQPARAFMRIINLFAGISRRSRPLLSRGFSSRGNRGFVTDNSPLAGDSHRGTLTLVPGGRETPRNRPLSSLHQDPALFVCSRGRPPFCAICRLQSGCSIDRTIVKPRDSSHNDARRKASRQCQTYRGGRIVPQYALDCLLPAGLCPPRLELLMVRG